MKPSTAKAKGRETENAFVQWLHSYGILGAERRRLNGVLDKGDIAGWNTRDYEKSVVVEVKSGAKIDMPKWLSELEAEVRNANANTGFVAVRPKDKLRVEDWFAVLPMPVMMELMREAGYLDV